MSPPRPPAGVRLLSTSEVAALYRVGTKTVSHWAKTGKVRALLTPGGQYRFPADQFAEVLRDDE